jgi:hypothetical protein
MAHDAFPPKDSEFNNWVVPFNSYIQSNSNVGASWMGISYADAQALNTKVTNWSNTYNLTLTPASAGPLATQAKTEARTALEAILRPLIRQLQANPAMTNDIRAGLGIHIAAGTHTRAPVPATAPQLTILNGLHLEHIIGFKDATSPNSKKKPDGVKCCRIYFKIGGAAPADLSQMAILDMPTATPYHAHFTGAQAGLVAYYQACWINTHNEAGPVSDVVSATIPG